MEFAEHDLSWKLETQRTKKLYLSEKEIWKTFIQITRGLAILHENSICHRDIKVIRLLGCEHIYWKR